VDEREAQIKLFGSSEDEFNLARKDWMSLYMTAADMMQVKCDDLEGQAAAADYLQQPQPEHRRQRRRRPGNLLRL
jgi:hypothetical protein